MKGARGCASLLMPVHCRLVALGIQGDYTANQVPAKRGCCRQHRKGIGVRTKFEVTEALLNIEGFPFIDPIPHSIFNTRSINKLDSYCRYLALEKVSRFGSIFSLEATLPAETDSGFYEL